MAELNDPNRSSRRGRGRAPGVFRAVNNPVYRTNPQTGNLELASEFDFLEQPEELTPAATPVTPEAVAPPPSPSPFSSIVADGSAPGGGEPGAPDAGEEGTGFSVSPGVAGGLGQVGGAIVGGTLAGPLGAMVLSEVGKEVGRSLAGGEAPSGNAAGGLAPQGVGPGGSINSEGGYLGDSLTAGVTGIPSEPGVAASPETVANFGVSDAQIAGLGESALASNTTTPSEASFGSQSDSGGGFDAGTEGDGFGGFSGEAIGGMDGGFGGDDGGIGDGGDGGGGDGGCYITEAVAATGAADNAPDLETLRWFRDNVLAPRPQGQALIDEYERAAPALVEAIRQRPDAAQQLQMLMGSYIQPAVEAVRAGQYDEALRLYAEMSGQAAEIAAEVIIDPELEAALEAFAQESAEVAHDGAMAGVATATGNDLVHPAEHAPSQPTSRLGRIFVGG